MFNGISVTNKGAQMLAAAQSGGSITFTRVQIGSGSLPSGTGETEITALVTPVTYLPIAEVERNASTVTVMFQVVNKNITQAFAFREIGLLASDGTGEYIYAYANAGEDAETIPLPSVTVIDYLMSLGLAISSDVENVSVEIDESLTFATKEDVADVVRQSDVIDIAHGGTGATTAADARTNLEITPGNIGAATSQHNHALVALSGTLSIDKGGTGATTAADARTKLGIIPANIGAAASGHTHSLSSSSISGTLPVNRGGTGKTTLKDAANALIDSLDVGEAAPNDEDYYVSQNVGDAENDGTYRRRPLSALWSWIKSKADAVYSAVNHGHSLTDSGITGTLSIGKGGTGATDAAAARTALGAQAALGFTPVQQAGGTNQLNNKIYLGWTGNSLDVQVDGSNQGTILTSGSAKTPLLPVSKGGTGSTTAAGARSNLGVINSELLVGDNPVYGSAVSLPSGSHHNYAIANISAAGVYLVVAEGQFAASEAGFRRLRIRVGSSQVIGKVEARPVGNAEHTMQCTAIVRVNGAAYFDFQAYQSSGSNLNFQYRTWLVKLC